MYAPPKIGRLRQGDIFRDIVFRDAYNTAEGDVTTDFCVVISQDCDLLQSHNNMKLVEADKDGTTEYRNVITRVIICPAYVATQLKGGEHMARIEWKMPYLNRGLWGPIANNETPRYHYLKESTEYGLPALVLDFKHMHTLPVGYLLKPEHVKVAKLKELFAQDVSLRFSNYVSRVALPDALDDDK